jgi:hypothetical protein
MLLSRSLLEISCQGAPVLVNVDSETQPVQVTDTSSGNIQTLKYLPPTVAHKTLGHNKEPAGLQKAQFRTLKKKSDQITDFLTSSQLTREEAWIYYYACYIAAVSYPLTASTLTFQQLDVIQRKAMLKLVAQCGFNWDTMKEVLYGPISLVGATFHHLYNQGISQVTYFLNHWRRNSIVGNLLRCTLAWLHFSVGISFSVLEDTSSNLPHLESKWIQSMRVFLSSIQATIQVDQPSIPSTQRQYDRHLMDVIVMSNRFKPAEIKRLNYCRLYLQVVTLSDITKPNGIDLDPTLLEGRPSWQSTTPRWHTKRQERPSEKVWKLWRKANTLWSDTDNRLYHPLGSWIVPLRAQRMQHFAYTHRSTLFIRNLENSYVVFHRTRHNTYRPSTTSQPQTYDTLPVKASPVDVSLAEDLRWRRTGPYSPIIKPKILLPSETATFDLFVTTLNPWEVDLLQHINMQCDPKGAGQFLYKFSSGMYLLT